MKTTNTRVVLTDDLDGTPLRGTEREVTHRFGVGKVNYEIHLSKRNAAQFRKALQPYLDAARKVRKSK